MMEEVIVSNWATWQECLAAFWLGAGSMVPFVSIRIAMRFWRRGSGDMLD